MKKVRVFLLVTLLSMVLAGTAVALPVPFEIGTGGYLDETVTEGLGLIATQKALAAGPIWLDTGETSEVLDLFKVWVPAALAKGSVDAYIDFLQPDPEGDVVSKGSFKVFSVFIGSKAELLWEDPEPVPYSYMGSTGGLLLVDLIDIPEKWQWGACYKIKGTITNVRGVPEPGTVFMLGLGLVGLAGYNRRKFKG